MHSGSAKISLEIEIWKSIPGILKSPGIDRQNLLPSIGGPVKHLFRGTEMDNDDHNLMKSFLKKF